MNYLQFRGKNNSPIDKSTCTNNSIIELHALKDIENKLLQFFDSESNLQIYLELNSKASNLQELLVSHMSQSELNQENSKPIKDNIECEK